MRDFMTGEDVTDQPERHTHLNEPVLLGRWTPQDTTNEH